MDQEQQKDSWNVAALLKEPSWIKICLSRMGLEDDFYKKNNPCHFLIHLFSLAGAVAFLKQYLDSDSKSCNRCWTCNISTQLTLVCVCAWRRGAAAKVFLESKVSSGPRECNVLSERFDHWNVEQPALKCYREWSGRENPAQIYFSLAPFYGMFQREMESQRSLFLRHSAFPWLQEYDKHTVYPLTLENIPRHWTGNQPAFLYFWEGLFFLLEKSHDLSLVSSPETHHIADSKMIFSF